jgi:hypothetical protein
MSALSVFSGFPKTDIIKPAIGQRGIGKERR